MTTLEQGIDALFQSYLDSLKRRREQQYNLSWLLKHQNIPFKPDYLTLGDYGSNFVETSLNRSISWLSPKLWGAYIWPRMYQVMIKTIDDKYMTKIDPKSKGIDSVKRQYLLIMETLFKKAAPHLHYSTFSELFAFTSQSLHHLSDYLEISNDFYTTEKQEHHEHCIRIRDMIYDDISDHKLKHHYLLYLCLRANWIDIVEDQVDTFLTSFIEEANTLLDNHHDINILGHGNPYYQNRLFTKFIQSKPKKILYELDNSGEVIFDLLLINTLIEHDHTVTIVAKEKPVLNDITIHDLNELLYQPKLSKTLMYLGQKKCQTVSSGSYSAGKLVTDVSQDYINAYTNSDVLILKGQGNFQTMPMGIKRYGTFIPYPYRKPIFYLMGVKAPMIEYSLHRIIQKKNAPLNQSMFMYYFSPNIRQTFPY